MKKIEKEELEFKRTSRVIVKFFGCYIDDENDNDCCYSTQYPDDYKDLVYDYDNDDNNQKVSVSFIMDHLKKNIDGLLELGYIPELGDFFEWTGEMKEYLKNSDLQLKVRLVEKNHTIETEVAYPVITYDVFLIEQERDWMSLVNRLSSLNEEEEDEETCC